MNSSNTITSRYWRKTAMTALCLIFVFMGIAQKKAEAQTVPYTGVPEADSLALVALYNSLSGDDWRDQGGWLTGIVSNWEGVRTANIGTDAEPEWVVDRIRIPNGNMTMPGTLPPEIGNLKYVSEIRIREDLLTDEIPPEIKGMIRLTRIIFNNNYLSGELPFEDIGQLDMNRLEAPENYFTGEFPSTMPSGGFNLIQRLDLRFNRFGGEIPGWIADLTNLRHLRLGHNNIGGDLPNLENLTNLDRLEIDNMPLTPGPIWAWIQNMGDHLDTVYMMNTNRTGTVPAWWADMPIIRSFGFGEDLVTLENGLGGELPDLSALTNANTIVLQGMHWTGPIPASLGLIQTNPRLFLRQCSFEGDIPGELANLGLFWVENCPNLTGGIPDEFQQYTGSQLVINNSPNDNNDYIYWPFEPEMNEYVGASSMSVGNIPNWLGDLQSLNYIVLSNVGITGPIPENLANLGQINALNLSYNPELTGTLPAWLGQRELGILDVSYTGIDVPEFPQWLDSPDVRGISQIGLSGLGMSGEIPWWIGSLNNLVSLSLADNNLEGSIPQGFGHLRRLDSLNLANNQLSGEIHSSFYNIGYVGGGFYGIESIDVSGNEGLTGIWSSDITRASEMRVFHYDGTGLVAPDDPAFDEWLDVVIPGNSDVRFPRIFTSVRKNIPTSIEDVVESPGRIHLYQNYPNPFNPSTTIKYDLPADVHVTLNVYNALGQKVATLVNDQQSMGSYEISFDASAFASGTYIYRLQAGDRVLNQSMMLIK